MTGVAAVTPSRRRPPVRSRAPAVGALVAQVAQALGNFVLQVLAARELGASGLGMFAFLFGTLVMATAVSTGLVGDSLTVLDRHEPAVRAALWRIGWLVVGISTVAAFVVGTQASPSPWGSPVRDRHGLLHARRPDPASADGRPPFLDAGGRRPLALAAAGLVLGCSALVGEVQLEHFLAALTVSQLTVVVVAFVGCPGRERRLPPWGWGDWRAVMHYGTWRAVQQFVRPTALNAARWLVLVAAGTAAVGQLEVARVFVAPAMLLVQGLGSYLFASYAADRDVGVAQLRGRADRAAAAMVGGAVVVGAAAAVSVPVLGHLLSAGAFEVSPLAALGWACYAASCAAVMPYGSLAAVRGRQLAVLVVRLVDAAVSLLLVAFVLLVVGSTRPWCRGCCRWDPSWGACCAVRCCSRNVRRAQVRRHREHPS